MNTKVYHRQGPTALHPALVASDEVDGDVHVTEGLLASAAQDLGEFGDAKHLKRLSEHQAAGRTFRSEAPSPQWADDVVVKPSNVGIPQRSVEDARRRHLSPYSMPLVLEIR